MRRSNNSSRGDDSIKKNYLTQYACRFYFRLICACIRGKYSPVCVCVCGGGSNMWGIMVLDLVTRTNLDEACDCTKRCSAPRFHPEVGRSASSFTCLVIRARRPCHPTAVSPVCSCSILLVICLRATELFFFFMIPNIGSQPSIDICWRSSVYVDSRIC